jgi:hypothetical protein
VGVGGQCHAPAALYPWGKDRRYQLDRRLGGFQRSQRLEEKSFTSTGFEPRYLGRPVCSHTRYWLSYPGYYSEKNYLWFLQQSYSMWSGTGHGPREHLLLNDVCLETCFVLLYRVLSGSIHGKIFRAGQDTAARYAVRIENKNPVAYCVSSCASWWRKHVVYGNGLRLPSWNTFTMVSLFWALRVRAMTSSIWPRMDPLNA